MAAPRARLRPPLVPVQDALDGWEVPTVSVWERSRAGAAFAEVFKFFSNLNHTAIDFAKLLDSRNHSLVRPVLKCIVQGLQLQIGPITPT